MSIGERIKSKRISKGLSREELGTAIGVSPYAIAKYEQGQREPKNKLLVQIANALDTSIGELISPQEQFKQDFDINDFDRIVIEYVESEKNKYANYFDENHARISNSIVIQNILIEYIASKDAMKECKIHDDTWQKRYAIEVKNDGINEIITGEHLYKVLYGQYIAKYIDDIYNDAYLWLIRAFPNKYNHPEQFTEDEMSLVERRFKLVPSRKIPEGFLKCFKGR